MNDRHMIVGVGLYNHKVDTPLRTRLKLAWRVLRGRFTNVVDQSSNHIVVSASGPHVIRVAPDGGLPANSTLHAYNYAMVAVELPNAQVKLIKDELAKQTPDYKP